MRERLVDPPRSATALRGAGTKFSPTLRAGRSLFPSRLRGHPGLRGLGCPGSGSLEGNVAGRRWHHGDCGGARQSFSASSGPGRRGAEPAPLAAGGVYRDAGLTAYVGRFGGRLSPRRGCAAGGGSRCSIRRGQRLRAAGGRSSSPGGARPRQRRGRARRRPRPRDRPAVAGDGPALRVRAARRAADSRPTGSAWPISPAPATTRRAQADVLRTLLASQELEAALSGGDPRRRLGGRDHPALADRLRQAARGRAGSAGTGRAATGGARGGRFSRRSTAWCSATGRHRGSCAGGLRPSRARFAFDPPRGYAVVNAPDLVAARGRGTRCCSSTAGPTRAATPRLPRPRLGAGDRARGRRRRDRRPAGRSRSAACRRRRRLSLANGGSRRVADLTVVRYGGRLYRLTGCLRAGGRHRGGGAGGGGGELPAADAGRGGGGAAARVRIHRIAAGDDVTAMAAACRRAASRAKFELINGLRPGRNLRVGTRSSSSASDRKGRSAQGEAERPGGGEGRESEDEEGEAGEEQKGAGGIGAGAARPRCGRRRSASGCRAAARGSRAASRRGGCRR